MDIWPERLPFLSHVSAACVTDQRLFSSVLSSIREKKHLLFLTIYWTVQSVEITQATLDPFDVCWVYRGRFKAAVSFSSLKPSNIFINVQMISFSISHSAFSLICSICLPFPSGYLPVSPFDLHLSFHLSLLLLNCFTCVSLVLTFLFSSTICLSFPLLFPLSATLSRFFSPPHRTSSWESAWYSQWLGWQQEAFFLMSFCLNKLYNASALLVWEFGDEGQEFEVVILKNPGFCFPILPPIFSAKRLSLRGVSCQSNSVR